MLKKYRKNFGQTLFENCLAVLGCLAYSSGTIAFVVGIIIYLVWIVVN